MKRILICLLTFISLGLNVNAQTISVADVEALSEGGTVQFKLHVSGVTAMTSMHFEVELPATFSVSGVSATTDWAAMFSREGGVVGAISSSDNALNGEGDAATVSVTIPGGTAVGEYPVTIDNIRINGTELGTAVVFNINVVARHTVVLDELSTTAPENATGVDVKVKRTINANEWSTICLPFAMSTAQLKAAFGDDVKLAEFDGIETTYDTDENVTNIRVKFNEATSIEANHPYLIEVTNAITSFSTENVDIEVEDEPSVNKDEYRTGSGTKKDPYVFHYNSFIGSYVAATDIPEECLFLNENKFWYSTGMTKMKAFRAYFDFYDVLSDVENAAARIIFAFSDETTGIHSIDNLTISPIDNDAPMYNLAGQKVSKSYKGIVIQNGVKLIVK